MFSAVMLFLSLVTVLGLAMADTEPLTRMETPTQGREDIGYKNLI